MAPPNNSDNDDNDTTTTAAAPAPASTSTKPIAFTDFCHPRPLSPGILEYVAAAAFTHLTPVQAATIPHFLSYKDVAVQAVTGSGKTLAFVIPLVELLLMPTSTRSRTQLGGLILAPTRELAAQTYRVTWGVCAAVGLPAPVLWTGGGTSHNNNNNNNSRPVSADVAAWAEHGSDIVVGTPGRVLDVLSRYESVDCSALECLILDEADRLLDDGVSGGFASTIAEIVRLLPKQRRTALFSATQSTAATRSHVKEWMHRMGMRNPMWIDVTVTAANATDAASQQQKQVTPTSLTNYYIVCPLEEKLSRLVAFLRQHRTEKKIIFFLTCASVDFFGHALQHILSDKDDNSIALLHGKMVQTRRDKTLARFRDTTTTTTTLCCTDVAARGLDVPNVQVVIQWDAPQHPSVFIHRAGRAGRAGQPGTSLVWLTPTEEPYVDLLAARNVPLQPLPRTTEQCVGPDMLYDDSEESTPPPENVTQQPQPENALWNAMGQPLEDVLPKVRALVCRDRDILEKGTKAYTSYIRAYKEHHCSFIFRFKALDLGRLATLFCLLRLPKMPELRAALQKHKKKHGGLPHFVSAGPEINIFAIPYLDKTREAARQKRLAQEVAAGGKTAKHVKAEQKKADRERKSKLQQKKRNQRSATNVADEWDDLAKEERLFKKLRRGKITQKEYEQRLLDDAT